MTVKEFFNGLAFKHHPNDPCSKQWASSAEMGNVYFPTHNQQLKTKLQSIEYLKKKSTFAVGGAVNYAISRMEGNECFVMLGDNLFLFASAIIGNPEKTCVMVSPTLKKGQAKRMLFPMRKDCHHFHSIHPLYYFQAKHEDRPKVGCLLVDRRDDIVNVLHMAENHLADGCLLVFTGFNDAKMYHQICHFVYSAKADYDVEFCVRTNPTGSKVHMTFWDGIMVIRKEKDNK